MRRRDLALGVAGLASMRVLPVRPLAAQNSGRLLKVAVLSPAIPDDTALPTHPLYSLLRRLAELGYVDGQNVEYEFRFAHHEIEQLPAMAAELVLGQPDVIYTWSSGGARAAAGATSTIPIVVGPVAEGTMAALVPDLARPPGNITGLTLNSRQQQEKCLQLLKEVAPDAKRIGLLLNPLNPLWQNYPDVLADAARSLDLTLIRMEARGTADLDQAFAAATARGIEAVFALSETTLVSSEEGLARIVQLLDGVRLPAVSDETDFTPGGGLMSLGPDFSAIGRGAADYIDRILQGAKVADLPVVLPSKFILAVNLKTAQQLGITIPPSILLRADEVIE
jgi:putative tryptophan/tyrosine transport system substrate-binding protein